MTIIRILGSIEHVLDLFIGPGDAHHIVAGVHLLNVAVEGTQVFLSGHKEALGAEHDHRHDEESQEGNAYGRQGHAPFGDEHHHQTAHKLGRSADDGGHTVGQGLLQRAHIVGDPAENVAVGYPAASEG